MSKILVCEDDMAIAEMIAIMLENNGFKVKVLPNCKAIQKKVKEYLPDLMLIDIWMPGLNGKEAIKLLKQDAQTKTIPIFIISALHENEIAQIVKNVQADGYLSKPFNMDDLLSIARKYTD